jgi:glucan phosphorylase
VLAGDRRPHALYLLDSNDPFNAPADRGLTSALYGGSSEVRLLQEIILGVGGWRLSRRSGSGSRSAISTRGMRHSS